MKNNKISKAFTLAEIFIAMVILSVLVSVCLAYFVKKRDYAREYFYYSAYKNIVNVVDSALMNEDYLQEGNPRVYTDYSSNPIMRKFATPSGNIKNLCDIFYDYFNTVESMKNSSGTAITRCTQTTSSPAGNVNNMALKLTNGMVFYFKAYSPADISELANESGYTFWVDINGPGEGEDKLYYDVMPFYVTVSGKVVPVYGKVEGLRGYEYSPADLDAAGNPTLITFDVVYKSAGDNELHVLDNGRFVSFREAACLSGYLDQATDYCSKSGTGYSAVTKDVDTCTNDVVADCKIRLVKKLKRLK